MKPDLAAFADLEQFCSNIASWRTDETLVVHRASQSRFVIQCQSNTDGWAAIERDEVLEAAELDSSELDCAQFAHALTSRLGQHLSIRDLEALIPRLQAELDARHAERQQAVAVLQQALRPGIA